MVFLSYVIYHMSYMTQMSNMSYLMVTYDIYVKNNRTSTIQPAAPKVHFDILNLKIKMVRFPLYFLEFPLQYLVDGAHWQVCLLMNCKKRDGFSWCALSSPPFQSFRRTSVSPSRELLLVLP